VGSKRLATKCRSCQHHNQYTHTFFCFDATAIDLHLGLVPISIVWAFNPPLLVWAFNPPLLVWAFNPPLLVWAFNPPLLVWAINSAVTSYRDNLPTHRAPKRLTPGTANGRGQQYSVETQLGRGGVATPLLAPHQ